MNLFPIRLGNNIIRLDETDSTNAFIQRLVNSGYEEEGLVVITQFQNNGRGQKGTVWYSEPAANLMLSVLLTPVFLQAEQQFCISQVAALAVRETIDYLLPQYDVLIKWPNDIWIEEQKVAGILIENTIQGRIFKLSIVGIGINVNDAPQNINATSLNHFNSSVSLKTVETVLLRKIENYYKILQSGDLNMLQEEYLKYLFCYKQPHSFYNNKLQSAFSATITGISPYGQLLLESSEGEELCFGIKEISFI